MILDITLMMETAVYSNPMDGNSSTAFLTEDFENIFDNTGHEPIQLNFNHLGMFNVPTEIKREEQKQRAKDRWRADGFGKGKKQETNKATGEPISPEANWKEDG